MSELFSTLLLITGLGLTAHLTSWAIVGGVLAASNSASRGIVFAGSMSAARIVQAVLGGGALLALAEGILQELKLSRATYYILILAGATLLVGTVLSTRGGRSLRERSSPKPRESQESPSPWRGSLTAFGLTMASPRQWLFTTGVVSSIGGLKPDPIVAVGLFALYLLLSCWITLGLVAIRVALPSRYTDITASVEQWGGRYGGRVVTYLLLLAGVAMIVVGAVVLWG
jgi:hypothetical protein